MSKLIAESSSYRAVQVSLLFPNIPKRHSRKIRPRQERYRGQDSARLRSLQYFGCRWQRWQVTYATVGRYQTPRCDLQDTSLVIWHRGKHTVYPFSRSPALPLSVSLSPLSSRYLPLHSSHTYARYARTWNSKCLSLSGAEGAWPSATYRALLRFPFSRSCSKGKDTSRIREEEKKKIILLVQYAEASRIFHECSFFVRFAVCSNSCAHVPWLRTREEKSNET